MIETFVMKRNAVNRLYFVYKDIKGETVAVSQSFTDRASLEVCISNIRNYSKIAPIFELADQKVYPCFIIMAEPENRFSFSMYGFAGETLFNSEAFGFRDHCVQSIEDFKMNAWKARLEDLI